MSTDEQSIPQVVPRGLYLAALGYICIPSILFILFWFKPALSMPLVAALVAVFGYNIRKAHRDAFARTPWRRLAAFFVAAALFDLLSGVNGLLYLNADLIVRSYVLNDLIKFDWPVVYSTTQGDFLLRAPLAYYMPAALVGKLAGFKIACHVMWLWNSLGLALVLGILFHDKRTLVAVLATPVFFLFSGMDILGVMISFLKVDFTSCIEWWSQYFQIPANTTSIFWAPNHAIPTWILSAMFIRQLPSKVIDPLIPIAILLLCFWSPVAAPGVAFLFLITYWRRIPEFLRDRNYLICSLIGVLALVPFALFITSEVATIDTTLAQDKLDIYSRSVERILFVAFEFMILIAVIFRYSDDKFRLACSAVFLTVLTTFDFGPGNDFLLRSSNPPMLLLFWCALNALQRMANVQAINRVKLTIAILAIGAVTSIMEIDRAIFFENNWMIPQMTLYEMSRGKAHHYTAKMSEDLMALKIIRLKGKD